MEHEVIDGKLHRIDQSDLFEPHFNGPVYSPPEDHKRLTGQIKRVRDLMIDSKWRTLSEIERATGDPSASISAQLRHLRKPRFGSYIVDKRYRGNRIKGLWEYKLLKEDKCGMK